MHCMTAVSLEMSDEPEINTFILNGALESKHCLFYYQADCLYLQRRRSGLLKVTRIDNMPIRI